MEILTLGRRERGPALGPGRLKCCIPALIASPPIHIGRGNVQNFAAGATLIRDGFHSQDTHESMEGVEMRQDVVLNLDDAVERMGDKDIYLEIAHYFAEHLPLYLRDLTTALDKGDGALATRLAHSLKGNCATVGAESLKKHCYSLEQLCRQESYEQAKMLYSTLVPQFLCLRNTLQEL